MLLLACDSFSAFSGLSAITSAVSHRQCQKTAPRELVSMSEPTTGDLPQSLNSHLLSDLETQLPFKAELSKTSPPIHPQHHLSRNIKEKAKKFYPFIARMKPNHGQSPKSFFQAAPPHKDKRKKRSPQGTVQTCCAKSVSMPEACATQSRNRTCHCNSKVAFKRLR